MRLPGLIEELVEEILLRLPPDEPAHLIRTAAVCKAWRRILLDDGGFRRRYCRFHRARPLLGYIHNVSFRAGVQFVPTTTTLFPTPPPPQAAAVSNSYRAIDCRHGRVLIDTSDCGPQGFIVWDPITGDQHHLSFPAHALENLSSFTGAVLCALDGCDHLSCHGGPFLVVFVGGSGTEGTHAVGVENTWASMYSSETGVWNTQISIIGYYVAAREPSLLIGDALYFTVCARTILKYDLSRHGLSLIDTPQEASYKSVPIDIDGGLGLVELSYHNCINTWSQQDDGANGVGGWLQHNVAKLETLIHTRRGIWFRHNSDDVIRFVEGTDTVLFSLNNYIDWGVFTLDFKSRKVRKFTERWEYDILPYTCFYTQDLAMSKQLSPR